MQVYNGAFLIQSVAYTQAYKCSL